MMVRVWEYEVAERSIAEFESAYGADGAWARLFAAAPDFLGSNLYRSVAAADRYITIDVFASSEAWQRFLLDHQDEYQQLDSRTAHLTRRETELVAVDTGDASAPP